MCAWNARLLPSQMNVECCNFVLYVLWLGILVFEFGGMIMLNNVLWDEGFEISCYW